MSVPFQELLGRLVLYCNRARSLREGPSVAANTAWLSADRRGEDR